MDQPLTTASFFDASLADLPPPPLPVAQPASSTHGLLRIVRITSVFVIVSVVSCGAALLWLNRDDIQDTARSARKRTANPVDFMLWFGGSDKTMEDVLVESQERNAEYWGSMEQESPLYDLDLDSTDWTAPGGVLISNDWEND